MEHSNLLDTKTVNSNEVLGNGKKYIVPIYQRDYSWKQDNWEDLWADILLIWESQTVHYMGAIVLQHKGNDLYAIIDGQQRLTTLTLIALACIQHIQELANNEVDKVSNLERVAILKNKFIGERDPSSLTYYSKLTLNENNDNFFQLSILPMKRPTAVAERKLKDSNKLLWKAFDFFYEKTKEHFKGSLSGEILARFLNEYVAKKLMFIQIIVEDELRAYTVFETLNSRGVGLTVTDLLKNYLFSLASAHDLPHIRAKWDKIVDTVGLDKFPTFLRHYWISRNKLVRQEYLYKSIRGKIVSIEDLSVLLDELEQNVEVYAALNHSADELWRGNKDLKKHIKELELFQVKQCLPLLLIAYEKLPSIFDKIAKVVTVISFRSTVVGGYHSGKLEEVYNKAALKIVSQEVSTIQQLADSLKELYMSDTDFKNDFSTLSLNTRRNKKLIRYILFELENQKKGSGSAYDFEDNPATIEHILPENADELWESFFPKNVMENYVFRLGNYTLLEASKNNKLGNQAYIEKLSVFQGSGFLLTNTIQAPEWNANAIDKRQSELAKIAVSIWKIPYF